MKERVRMLRKNQTDAEKKLWSVLRNKKCYGFKFRRQYCVSRYIVDFVCLSQKLVIEVDGEQHVFQKEYDAIRDKQLKLRGFKILRFWNDEVLQTIEKVLAVIYEHLSKQMNK